MARRLRLPTMMQRTVRIVDSRVESRGVARMTLICLRSRIALISCSRTLRDALLEDLALRFRQLLRLPVIAWQVQ